MRDIRFAVLAVAIGLAVLTAKDNAVAMPVDRLTTAVTQSAVGLETVAWHCGPYRCWRFGPFWFRPFWTYRHWGPPFGYWAPRPYWGRGGRWHRAGSPWWRWHHRWWW